MAHRVVAFYRCRHFVRHIYICLLTCDGLMFGFIVLTILVLLTLGIRKGQGRLGLARCTP